MIVRTIKLRPTTAQERTLIGWLWNLTGVYNWAIRCGRIVKRASGWYLCLWLDTDHRFPVKETDAAVGIDPGFHTLLTLSDGTTFENPRELRIGAKRLAQAQRGGDWCLAARLLERQVNRRKDRNHKISRTLTENYQTIFYSDDHFKGLARTHGKSVSEAGLGQLVGMLAYKGRTGGRAVIPVESKYTTMTCADCRSRTGPTGWCGLAVKQWRCSRRVGPTTTAISMRYG